MFDVCVVVFAHVVVVVNILMSPDTYICPYIESANVEDVPLWIARPSVGPAIYGNEMCF